MAAPGGSYRWRSRRPVNLFRGFNGRASCRSPFGPRRIAGNKAPTLSYSLSGTSVSEYPTNWLTADGAEDAAQLGVPRLGRRWRRVVSEMLEFLPGRRHYLQAVRRCRSLSPNNCKPGRAIAIPNCRAFPWWLKPESM